MSFYRRSRRSASGRCRTGEPGRPHHRRPPRPPGATGGETSPETSRPTDQTAGPGPRRGLRSAGGPPGSPDYYWRYLWTSPCCCENEVDGDTPFMDKSLSNRRQCHSIPTPFLIGTWTYRTSISAARFTTCAACWTVMKPPSSPTGIVSWPKHVTGARQPGKPPGWRLPERGMKWYHGS